MYTINNNDYVIGDDGRVFGHGGALIGHNKIIGLFPTSQSAVVDNDGVIRIISSDSNKQFFDENDLPTKEMNQREIFEKLKENSIFPIGCKISDFIIF